VERNNRFTFKSKKKKVSVSGSVFAKSKLVLFVDLLDKKPAIS
jgi:hypothetical protein